MQDKHEDFMPDQLWHRRFSFFKSGARIIGYILLPYDLMLGVVILVISEIGGIAEELV
jgi:hypothetical protein